MVSYIFIYLFAIKNASQQVTTNLFDLLDYLKSDFITLYSSVKLIFTDVEYFWNFRKILSASFKCITLKSHNLCTADLNMPHQFIIEYFK